MVSWDYEAGDVIGPLTDEGQQLWGTLVVLSYDVESKTAIVIDKEGRIQANFNLDPDYGTVFGILYNEKNKVERVFSVEEDSADIQAWRLLTVSKNIECIAHYLDEDLVRVRAWEMKK